MAISGRDLHVSSLWDPLCGIPFREPFPGSPFRDPSPGIPEVLISRKYYELTENNINNTSKLLRN